MTMHEFSQMVVFRLGDGHPGSRHLVPHKSAKSGESLIWMSCPRAAFPTFLMMQAVRTRTKLVPRLLVWLPDIRL